MPTAFYILAKNKVLFEGGVPQCDARPAFAGRYTCSLAAERIFALFPLYPQGYGEAATQHTQGAHRVLPLSYSRGELGSIEHRKLRIVYERLSNSRTVVQIPDTSTNLPTRNKSPIVPRYQA